MIKRLQFLTALVIAVLLLLTACTEQVTPTPPPTATAQPSVTPAQTTTTPEVSAAPPVVIVTPTPTTAPPTPTISPTSSPTAIPTPTSIATPSVTPLASVPLQPVRRGGGTFKVGVLDSSLSARNYSPYAPAPNSVSSHLARLVWGAALIYRDPVSLDWRTLAAQGLPVSDSTGRRYTFTLRDDLRWSNGSQITAADYLYAFNNARLPDNHAPQQSTFAHATLTGNPLNSRELTFTFDDTYATAFQTISRLEPLPSQVWSKYAFADPTQNPEINRPSQVSGPFLPDTTGLSFTANRYYVPFLPNFDRLELRSFKYPGDLNEGLKNGAINWSFEPFSPGNYRQFRQLTGLNTYTWLYEGADRRYIGYNLGNPFLQSRLVRNNLNRLLDTRSLIATVENGLATPQNGFLPAGSQYALRADPPSIFNPRQAHDELKDAGYTQRDQDDRLLDLTGKVIPPLNLIYANDSSEAAAIAVYLTQQYRQLGLVVQPEGLDPTTYQQRRTSGKYDLEIGLIHLPGALDPDDFKAQFVTGGALNFSGYSNNQVDNLFAAGLHTDPDRESQRRDIYTQLQQLLLNDSPVFFLYTLQTYTVMSNSVDPAASGLIKLTGWQLDWDAFPAYLNWYFRE